MKVLVLSNNTFEEREIKDTLGGLQEIVGGYIEIPYLSRVFNDNEIDIIINEEGKYIEGLKPEIAVINKETQTILDIVYGNCVFASHDYEGNTTELSEKQKGIIINELKLSATLQNPNTSEHHLVKVLLV